MVYLNVNRRWLRILILSIMIVGFLLLLINIFIIDNTMNLNNLVKDINKGQMLLLAQSNELKINNIIKQFGNVLDSYEFDKLQNHNDERLKEIIKNKMDPIYDNIHVFETQFDIMKILGQMTVTVVDTFMYNGEPIVPVRLKILYDHIDRFYIVEGTKTFTGIEKDYLFKDINFEAFKPYDDKISWLVIDDPPDSNFTTPRKKEYFKRNCIIQAMKEDLSKDIISRPFVIIATDADEIPNPQVIDEFQLGKKWISVITRPAVLEMMWFSYNFNWRKRGYWRGPHVLPGDDVLSGKFDLHIHRTNRGKRMAALQIPAAGWHCGYFLSIEGIMNKIESSIHTEFNKPEYKVKERLIENIKIGQDLFYRTDDDEQVDLYNYKLLPIELQKFHLEICSIQNVSASIGLNVTQKYRKNSQVSSCFCRETCTKGILDLEIPDFFSCRKRINFLMEHYGDSERKACVAVATDIPQCGKCNPDKCPVEIEVT